MERLQVDEMLYSLYNLDSEESVKRADSEGLVWLWIPAILHIDMITNTFLRCTKVDAKGVPLSRGDRVRHRFSEVCLS